MKVLKSNKQTNIFRYAAAMLTWLYWGNTSVQLTKHTIQSKDIPEAFHGFRIVQISDFHNRNFGWYYKRLIRRVKETSPDIIVITGDLFDSRRTHPKISMKLVIDFMDIAPVYYVTGNHESRIGQYECLERRMQQEGVVVLRDREITLEKAGQSLNLAGLEDPAFLLEESWMDSEYYDMLVKLKLKKLCSSEKTFRILLTHRPELFPAYCSFPIDLVLCGHAHGGQVRLPILGSVFAPGQGLFPPYAQGIHEKNQTRMIVNRGLGHSVIPLRINNRPELIVVTLSNAVHPFC